MRSNFARLDEKRNLFEFWEMFPKFWKDLLRKLLKMDYFAIFCKTFNKPCVNFLRFWTKNPIYWKFWENFRKFFKKFLKKIAKMHYLSIDFKRFNKPCVNFSRVWTKNEKCWEILRNFWGKFYRKIEFFLFF